MTTSPFIEQLRGSLADYGANAVSTADFVALWRTAPAELAGLPPRFGEVLDDLLMRVESSQMFTEESCSFSRGDLVRNLEVWLEKAVARLAG